MKLTKVQKTERFAQRLMNRVTGEDIPWLRREINRCVGCGEWHARIEDQERCEREARAA